MRASIFQDDPGYKNFHPGKTRVFINGDEVTNRCQTADEEFGEALCLKLDQAGRPYVDPENPNELLREILTGAVQIFSEV